MTPSCPGIFSALGELLTSLAAEHSSCANCLQAASPAARDHQRPQPRGHWQVGPRGEKLPLSSECIFRVSLVSKEQGCEAKRNQAPGLPLFLAVHRTGPASGQQGTRGTSLIPSRQNSGPKQAMMNQRLLSVNALPMPSFHRQLSG